MIALTLAKIAEITGGDLAPESDPDLVVAAEAYLDSRDPVPSGLFVAIVGEHVDGHDHAAGAHAVLGSRPTEAPTVVVPDVTAALGTLARYVLEQVRPVVFAMTGSQGKTGTKDYLTHLLTACAPTVATRGNFNNELGVPLTVLRIDPETRYLVVEMGARGMGHIAQLCQIAPPDVAALLNVGSAHLGEFGTVENIALAKGEIFENLRDPDASVAVVNADDPASRDQAQRHPGAQLSFGTVDDADVRWSEVSIDDHGCASFTLHHGDLHQHCQLKQPGIFQIANAAAAFTLAVAGGAEAGQCAQLISSAAQASRWRMEPSTREDGLVVLNDAYNANPEAVIAALDTLAVLGQARTPRRRRVAVLGVMLELGDQALAGHRRVGAAAAERADVLLVVGDQAAGISQGARSAGMTDVVQVADADAASSWLAAHTDGGDAVLVKASRGAALERVAASLSRAQ